MILEIFLAQASLLKNGQNELLINDGTAYNVGIDFTELREQFAAKTGRVILNNEYIKVRFSEEGKHLDFSTFDDVHFRVDFSLQRVAPNKGGDGFEDQ